MKRVSEFQAPCGDLLQRPLTHLRPWGHGLRSSHFTGTHRPGSSHTDPSRHSVAGHFGCTHFGPRSPSTQTVPNPHLTLAQLSGRCAVTPKTKTPRSSTIFILRLFWTVAVRVKSDGLYTLEIKSLTMLYDFCGMFCKDKNCLIFLF